MTTRTIGTTLTAVILAVVSLAAAEPAPAPVAGSVRDVVYFGPGGPYRVRLHVAIDGKPVDAGWAAAVDALFAFCDRNGDGVLDQAERALLAPPALRRGRDIMLGIDQEGMTTSPIQLTFPKRDENVTRAAFAEAIRTAGAGAIDLSGVTGPTDSAALSAALFRHLDADKDGKISPGELKTARERLAILDVNEDEILSGPELLGRAVSTAAVRTPVALGMRATPEAGSASPDILFLPADDDRAVKYLLTTRGSARATALTRAEFGADAATFAALDKDGNGRLDTAELAEWLRQSPAAELALSFSPPDQAARWSAPSPGTRGAQITTKPDGPVVAAWPGTFFRFERPRDDRPSLRAAWDEQANGLRKRLKDLAKDGGPVARKAIESDPLALALFDFADRNADGKLDPAKEAEAALKLLAPLVGCRVNVRFVDEGNGLFELLDKDGDGRLTPRELVEAAAVLKSYADRDGNISPASLPRRVIVRAEVESITLVVPLRTPRVTDMASRPARASGPEWFEKMDRNGDGDVSLREFLGPIALFRKLDRDGDELLSPEEAKDLDR
ncbi:EF-hand domain-containing protein [Fimbriiglobus ruber]|uniref:EF-hand domain-containing protein n=1 Tax=Fimbriiglobus ruber TaxID=1908690 RepID=A0A225D582_9BACT|nr:EF-hand domain-containing protein [Fimbriiglobus ruber]OWK36113.1 hypothetical protein FRUB_08676 [Fimbriiglobus ruber]